MRLLIGWRRDGASGSRRMLDVPFSGDGFALELKRLSILRGLLSRYAKAIIATGWSQKLEPGRQTW
jgi:hypothetical protein